MLKIVTSVFIVMAMVGIVRSEAQACSCFAVLAPPEAIAQADAVFEGEVQSDVVDGSGLWPRTLNFRVLRAWKGVSADSVVPVQTGVDGAGCGYSQKLTPGTAMLVYAYSNAGSLTTNICTRTRGIAEADEDIAALGSPASVSTSSTPQGGSETPGAPNGSGCVVSGSPDGRDLSPVGLGALLAAGLLVTGRRWRRISVSPLRP